ncbi:MAG: molybdopterin molybdotransferase MoeA [Chloroflexota bacterium]|nr:molybdopterin molybdotransferase MoeA [Chloroflexota bacterium]
MLSVKAALERLLTAVDPLGTEDVPLDAALGRVAARAVTAPVAVPPFTNSSMDGFAVRGADVPGTLRLVGEVRAGSVRHDELAIRTAVRIMTGAPLPPGADTVLPQELAEVTGETVHVGGNAPRPGSFVRRAGEDTTPGDEVVGAGDELTPARIAVLASCGVAVVSVRRRPRVAVLSTGDEITPPGERLRPGAIYDANSPALAAAVREAGGDPLPQPATGDDRSLIERRLRDAAEQTDAVLVSGGVSVGDHDHVRTAIERLGTLDFWKIRMQPGKPLAFGRIGGTPVIGLPGNPVSALVTFEVFVRPMLRRFLGTTGDGRVHVVAHAREPIPKDAARRAYLRVRLHATASGYEATSAGGQSSGQLRPLADANALLVVPEGVERAEPGTEYEAIVVGALA